MISRREWLQQMTGAAGILALGPQVVLAQSPSLLTRSIPRTGERLPLVGLGSSATFAQVARSDDVAALRAVLEQMVSLGGTVFDTAPAYGASEEVAGRLAQELGIGDVDHAPATSRPANMADNMGGAMGRLPDAGMRKRMIQLVEELP